MGKRTYVLALIFILELGFLSFKSTFALFSDNATSSGNIFAAASIFPSPSATATASASPSGSPAPTPDPFADAVTSVTGTFGHCCSGLSSNPGVAAPLVTGAPDSPPDEDFIQISDSSSIILQFVDNKAVDGTGADIRVYTYDALFPANAKVEVSADGSTFFEAAASVPDTSNQDIEIPDSLTEVRYVKITDLVGDVEFPSLGYDLDAVEALNNAAP